MSELSKSQQIFYDKAINGKSIFLSGKAGTGKTFITKKVVSDLTKKGKNVAIVAPTGIAASNAGGATIHSTFSLPIDGLITYGNCQFLKSNKRDVLKKIDVLVIDEISMVRADMFDAINWTLIKNGCRNLKEIQVLIIGDMKQLEPVADDNMKSVMYRVYDGITFDYSNIFKSMNVETIELKEVLRQSDPEFIDALNVVRDGGKDAYFKRFVKKEPVGIVLAPHLSTVNKYNEEGLKSIDSEMLYFKAIMDGNIKNTDTNLEPNLYLKDGCKIMYLINSKNNRLHNGTIGILRVKRNGNDINLFIEVNQVKHPIEQFKATKNEYVLNQKENKLELKEIGSIQQYPIKLAYAISIHKSQGLTFDEGTIDLTRPCFSKGQMYVALSRFKTPNGLNILVNRNIK